MFVICSWFVIRLNNVKTAKITTIVEILLVVPATNGHHEINDKPLANKVTETAEIIIDSIESSFDENASINVKFRNHNSSLSKF